jgi:hypothetical protein
MSGLGIEYPPPTETLPIFDATVFLLAEAETLGGLIPIIPSPAGSYVYSSITVNDYGQVTAASSGAGIPPLVPSPAGVWEISENSDITVTQFGQVTAITGGALNSNPPQTYTNATVTVNKYGQVTAGSSGAASIPLTPTGVVAGPYTNTDLTVNTYGQITTASNGTPAIPLTPTGVVAGPYTNTNLTVNTYGQITTASNGTAGIPATPTITAGTTNFTQDGSVTYNQFGQITSATSGVIPSFVGGNFTNPSLTVNTYGQITTITNGAGTLLQTPTYIQSSLTSTVSGTFPIPPAGAKTMKVICISAGGPTFGPINNNDGTITVGCAGFSGAYASFTADCSQWNTLTEPLLGYNNQGVSTFSGSPANCPVVFWTPYAGSIYPANIANPPLPPPSGNGYFGNGQVSLPTYRLNTTSSVNFPYNMYQADLMTCINAPNSTNFGTFGIPANNEYGVLKTSTGAGSQYYSILPTATINLTEIPGRNALAENAPDANIIGPWAWGAYVSIVANPADPNNPVITAFPQGQGGWAVYFYS